MFISLSVSSIMSRESCSGDFLIVSEFKKFSWAKKSSFRVFCIFSFVSFLKFSLRVASILFWRSGSKLLYSSDIVNFIILLQKFLYSSEFVDSIISREFVSNSEVVFSMEGSFQPCRRRRAE